MLRSAIWVILNLCKRPLIFNKDQDKLYLGGAEVSIKLEVGVKMFFEVNVGQQFWGSSQVRPLFRGPHICRTGWWHSEFLESPFVVVFYDG